MTIDDEKLRRWLEAAVESAFRAGAAEERAAVVSMLRAEANAVGASPDEKRVLHWAIRSIERGEHRKGEP